MLKDQDLFGVLGDEEVQQSSVKKQGPMCQ